MDVQKLVLSGSELNHGALEIVGFDVLNDGEEVSELVGDGLASLWLVGHDDLELLLSGFDGIENGIGVFAFDGLDEVQEGFHLISEEDLVLLDLVVVTADEAHEGGECEEFHFKLKKY